MPIQQAVESPDLEITQLEEYGALTQLRAMLAQQEFPPGSRLPAERSLCKTLGVSRSALRKALATLEAEGQIWRHVGQGTFIGSRAAANSAEIGFIAGQTNPAQVMEARLAIEPELARLAALHATANDLAELELCLTRSRAAENWRVYETWDNRLHRTVAEATHNPVLIALFDTLNTVRRTVVWGRLRPNPTKPASDHHSFAEHEALVQAIRERDMAQAAKAMRAHLESVRRHLLLSQMEN